MIYRLVRLLALTTDHTLPYDPNIEGDPMNMQEYLKNRAAFPLDELAKHRGEWVAWSPDGTRLVATSRNPDVLDDLVRAAGEDPENCLVEGIPDTDCVIGGLGAL